MIKNHTDVTEVKANTRKIPAKRENDAIKGEKNNYEMQNDHRVVKKNDCWRM